MCRNTPTPRIYEWHNAKPQTANCDKEDSGLWAVEMLYQTRL